jgi:hypothetical protein
MSYREAKCYRKPTAEIEAYLCSLKVITYRLIRRYETLKVMLRTLRINYDATKKYPIFPRNLFLKVMVKQCVNKPEFYEICQEVEEMA